MAEVEMSWCHNWAELQLPQTKIVAINEGNVWHCVIVRKTRIVNSTHQPGIVFKDVLPVMSIDEEGVLGHLGK